MAEFLRLQEQFSDDFERAAIEALINGIRIVRHAATYGVVEFGQTDSADIKADHTFVTATDLASEAAITEVFLDHYPDIELRGEEGTKVAGTGRRVGIDPQDGTRDCVIGAPNATAIATEYDQSGKAIGAAIADIRGIVVSNFDPEIPVLKRLIDLDSGETLAVAEAKLWPGDVFDKKAQVLIDKNLVYAPADRLAGMSSESNWMLREKLGRNGVNTLDFGSNGANQMYMLLREYVAGAISTARGIPEDTTAGALLVARAGGFVSTYTSHKGMLSAAADGARDDDVTSYNLMLAANTASSHARLEEMLYWTHGQKYDAR